jgi:predicted RNA-binding Zn-ribbon protein involved in translation (DUF1610 family)
MNVVEFNIGAISTVFLILAMEVIRDLYHRYRSVPDSEPYCDECLEVAQKTDLEMADEWECPSCGKKIYKDSRDKKVARLPLEVSTRVYWLGNRIEDARPFSFLAFSALLLVAGAVASFIDMVVRLGNISIGTGVVVVLWLELSDPLYAGIRDRH